MWSQSHSDIRGYALQTRPGAYKQYAGACTHACDVSADEEHAWSAGAHFQLGFLRGPGPGWQPHSAAGAAAESFAPGPDMVTGSAALARPLLAARAPRSAMIQPPAPQSLVRHLRTSTAAASALRPDVVCPATLSLNQSSSLTYKLILRAISHLLCAASGRYAGLSVGPRAVLHPPTAPLALRQAAASPATLCTATARCEATSLRSAYVLPAYAGEGARTFLGILASLDLVCRHWLWAALQRGCRAGARLSAAQPGAGRRHAQAAGNDAQGQDRARRGVHGLCPAGAMKHKINVKKINQIT